MDNKVFLGKYRVTAEEMAAVGEIADNPLAYEGEEIDSGRRVVVEVVPAAPLKTAVREQLESEAMAAKKLSHVNIPALYDFGVEDDHLIYVTENLDGTPAVEWVNAHGPMPLGPVLRIAAQVVGALTAAAFHRINHHAINPSNLLLVPGQTEDGDWPLVKVLHFVGVAPKVSETNVAVAAFDKSLQYASPEQIQTGSVDFRSELYSLGSTMWFLLTGAPPLAAPGGAAAAPLATEKIAAVPKNVRRLLAEMLAVNPEARPSDPLVFYRKLQDCLSQVERRETMARRFGIPSFSAAGLPRRRRIPAKALALAALFLALAAGAALVVSGSLRHGRIVRQEEPIGKPIGVPEASAAATPATANANVIASNTVPTTTTVADSNSAQLAPPQNAELPPANAPIPSTDSEASASISQIEMAAAPPSAASDSLVAVTPAPPPAASDFPVEVAAAPPSAAPDSLVAVTPAPPPAASDFPVEVAAAPPAVADSSKEAPSQEPVLALTNKAVVEPAVANSREIAANKQAEPTPAEKPEANTSAVAQNDAPKKDVMRELRPAEPEVRRAQPPPPGEGTETVVTETTTVKSEAKIAEKSPAKKTERLSKPKRQAEKKTHTRERLSKSERAPQSGRARFVGVTPEGWWMLELPSHEIIIVPPRPSSP